VIARRSDAFLLFGVTGSGKTVVYIEVLREALARGFSGLVLVPEISLTPQTISRFREVFPGKVATVHSGLGARERFEIWRAAREGKARILVGPRSAVFAPMANLGVIVIDEEHESSYKQDDTPRYHAREVALKRAAIEGAAVVLGSATPSLESYRKAQEGSYHMLELPERVGAGRFPAIRIIDMKEEDGRPVISESLRKGIAQRIGRKEQVILFLNRRGYSSFLQCGTCGWVIHCEECNIALTVHRRPLSLVCHYCNYKDDIPEKCPKCGRGSLSMRGVGTERVDREIKEMFSGVKVERMDLDTTSGKWSHRDILVKFLSGETQILLGTQMIAKGLDFPNVTLVGVVSADTGLNLPDYRATERAFQILTQVSGRTGRGEKGGEVIIQTYMSDVSVIEAVERQDYRKFAEGELAVRRDAEYPPYFALANIIAVGKEEEEVREVAWEMADALGALAGGVENEAVRTVGPAPCAYTKLRGMFRWHILVKSRDPESMEKILYEFAGTWYRGKGGVRVMVDRDPMSLM
jgi:primosomal protein N' (replication factor Y)